MLNKRQKAEHLAIFLVEEYVRDFLRGDHFKTFEEALEFAIKKTPIELRNSHSWSTSEQEEYATSIAIEHADFLRKIYLARP